MREALPDYLKGFVKFGYKTGWRVLDDELKQIIIVNDADLREAAIRQSEYLEKKMGTISGTVTKIGNKKGLTAIS